MLIIFTVITMAKANTGDNYLHPVKQIALAIECVIKRNNNIYTVGYQDSLKFTYIKNIIVWIFLFSSFTSTNYFLFSFLFLLMKNLTVVGRLEKSLVTQIKFGFTPKWDLNNLLLMEWYTTVRVSSIFVTFCSLKDLHKWKLIFLSEHQETWLKWFW